MIRYVFCLLVLFNVSLQGQSYFSHIVSIESTVNIQGLKIIDDETLSFSYLGYIDSLGGSVIVNVDLSSMNESFLNFPGYIFSENTPIFQNELYHVYADDIARSPAASFLQISQHGTVIDKVEYPEWEEDMGVRKMFQLGDNLYNVSIVQNEEFPKALFMINKTDYDGSILWRKTYGDEDSLKITVFQDATLDDDNNIWVGAGIADYDRNGTYSRIIKMDTSGNILCQYTDTLEPCVIPESNQEVISYSSGIIVHQTSLDKLFDEEYELNEWYSRPRKYTWLDHKANFIMDTIYNTHEDDEEFISGIVKGNGDYFFSYGRLYEWPDDTYGIIQKIGLDGTLSWTKRYKHPEYIDVNDRYIIDHLLELDNGDLITVGVYNNIQEGIFDPWIMRLNENGCFGGDDCGDIVLSSEDHGAEYNNESILIAPNPSNGRFTITSNLALKSYRIFSLDGMKVVEGDFEIEKSIDITNLPDGTYIIEIVTSDGNTERQTILKLGL